VESLKMPPFEGYHTLPLLDECETLIQKSTFSRSYEFTQEDLKECEKLMKKGSSSFWTASLALPAVIRQRILQIYSFCRISDDMVDESGDPSRALKMLRQRLDLIYKGTPCDHHVDRAFADVVQKCRIPRVIPEMLLEGFEWDSIGREYNTIEEMIEYCVRVASTVGVMVTIAMDVTDYETLARACDLGVGFQMTNIARDVGEDARNKRVYVPEEWLQESGTSSKELLNNIVPSKSIERVVDRLLKVADQVYTLADEGIEMLPLYSRFAIRAARYIYSDIGRVIRDENKLDSISSRARTTTKRKMHLMFTSLTETLVKSIKLPILSNFKEPKNPQTPIQIIPQYSALIAPFLTQNTQIKSANLNFNPIDENNSPGLASKNGALFQTEYIGKLEYLKEAKKNGNAGVFYSVSILSLWAIAITLGFRMQVEMSNAYLWLPLILVQTNLFCGIFITAHDAMHGVVCPSNRKLNNFIGSLCVTVYAMFDYKLLLESHWKHHLKPASLKDPDYHDGENDSFWSWFFKFFYSYSTFSQFSRITAGIFFFAFVVGVPFENLILFWAVPAVASAIQLFYFGTYLPHKEPEGGHVDANRSVSNNLPTLLSFLTCYHFGYHWEHHQYPYVPWWKLPSVRQDRLQKLSKKSN